MDVIERGSRVFEELVVGILINPEKDALFTLDERREMLVQLTARLPNVRVSVFGGLLVEFARQEKAHVVVRGIRAISDYEYELQMALMNRKLEPSLETVFLTAAEEFSYLSSRIVKDIARLGGAVDSMVPPLVKQRLHAKLAVSADPSPAAAAANFVKEH